MPADIRLAKLSHGVANDTQRAACKIRRTTGYLEAKFNVGLPNDVIDFKQLVDQMHTLGVVTMQAAADMQHCTVHGGA